MKAVTLALLILGPTLWVLGKDNPSKTSNNPAITTKIAEKDRDHDGVIDLKVETTFRGSLKIMQQISMKRDAHWSSFRMYYAGPHVACTETDDDGDGVFEFFIIYDKAGNRFEAFERRDGIVCPVTNEQLKRLRGQDDYFKRYWDNTFNAK